MEVPFPRQVWNLHLLRTRTSQHKLDSTIDREQADRPGRREANSRRATDETANSATRARHRAPAGTTLHRSRLRPPRALPTDSRPLAVLPSARTTAQPALLRRPFASSTG